MSTAQIIIVLESTKSPNYSIKTRTQLARDALEASLFLIDGSTKGMGNNHVAEDPALEYRLKNLLNPAYDKDCDIAVAYIDKVAIAVAIVDHRKHIMAYVSTNYRRLGIGSTLVNKLSDLQEIRINLWARVGCPTASEAFWIKNGIRYHK